MAEDNYRALVDFFRKFPNLKKNDFYISGESYAGIYVPTLAMEILNHNRLPERELTINLKGIMIGNACTDPRECYEPSQDDSMSIYQYEYLHNHGYITDNDYLRITGACTLGYGGAECKRLRAIQDKAFDETETIINNIYEPCYHQVIPNADKSSLEARSFTQSRFKSTLGAYKTCEDLMGIINFLNEPLMQESLHVNLANYDICSDEVSRGYKMNPNASEWIYPSLIRANIRILIFSGDHDANVPITGTMRWI